MKRRYGVSWWLWVFTAWALGAHLVGWRFGVPVSGALVAVQLAVQIWRWRTGRAGALPLQVRVLFLTFLLAGTWPPLRALHILQLAGMTVLLVFDYCLAGRLLSLLPWNRSRPLTVALLWATFRSPRVWDCRSIIASIGQGSSRTASP